MSIDTRHYPVESVRTTAKLARAHALRAVQLAEKAKKLETRGILAEADELRAAATVHQKAADAGRADDRGQLFAHASHAGVLEDSAAWCRRRRLGLAG